MLEVSVNLTVSFDVSLVCLRLAFGLTSGLPKSRTPHRRRFTLVFTSKGFCEIERDSRTSRTNDGPAFSVSDGKDVLVSRRLDIRGKQVTGEGSGGRTGEGVLPWMLCRR